MRQGKTFNREANKKGEVRVEGNWIKDNKQYTSPTFDNLSIVLQTWENMKIRYAKGTKKQQKTIIDIWKLYIL